MSTLQYQLSRLSDDAPWPTYTGTDDEETVNITHLEQATEQVELDDGCTMDIAIRE